MSTELGRHEDESNFVWALRVYGEAIHEKGFGSATGNVLRGILIIAGCMILIAVMMGITSYVASALVYWALPYVEPMVGAVIAWVIDVFHPTNVSERMSQW